jgi:DNA-binding MarR family transcriptional regulator
MIEMNDRMSLGDSRHIVTSIRRLVQFLRVARRAAERETGLTAAQIIVLEEVAKTPGMSLGKLAEHTCTDQSSACVVVARLVRDGFVRQDRSPRDARRVMLTLTKAGEEVISTIGQERSSDDIADVLSRFDESERAVFADMLDRVVGELSRQRAASAPPPPVRRRRNLMLAQRA